MVLATLYRHTLLRSESSHRQHICLLKLASPLGDPSECPTSITCGNIILPVYSFSLFLASSLFVFAKITPSSAQLTLNPRKNNPTLILTIFVEGDEKSKEIEIRNSLVRIEYQSKLSGTAPPPSPLFYIGWVGVGWQRHCEN